MEFLPINGQSLADCSRLRLGWCRLKTNGCAIIAIYNALGLLGQTTPIYEILHAFQAWYRPHLFGISPRRIRAYFCSKGIPTARNEHDWHIGDVAIVTYWNRRFWKIFANPFCGAHTVCVRYDGKFWVYNRFSNRAKTYCYESLDAFLSKRKVMQILKIKCNNRTTPVD